MIKSVVEETKGESGLCCASQKGQYKFTLEYLITLRVSAMIKASRALALISTVWFTCLKNSVRRGRLFQTGSVAQQLRFVGFFPWEVFAAEVAVSCGFFVDRVQQIQHLNQAIRA